MKIIQCSNDYACEVSNATLNNKNVLKIDFNIKSYQSMETGLGWVERPFPKEVLPSIKDTLYIDNKNIHEVILVLDAFIKTGDIDVENVSYTKRGFCIMELQDKLGNVISMQKSSAASEEKLWFGVELNTSDIGEKKDGHFIRYQYPKNNGVSVNNRLHLTIEQTQQLRMAILNEMAPIWGPYEVADLIDKKTVTATNMIMDVWGDLSKNIQSVNFGYACGKGNLDVVKKIYTHPENKFLHETFSTFEEYGIQSSMQPESKKVLKFFKDRMKEKEMELSHSMKKWVRDNKLGRKIKVND